MTNEEAKVFLDNLKICIDEHPVVADWLVEIENRKDEQNSSEKPNNCEPQTCGTCKHKGDERYCRDCCNYSLYEKDEPQTDCETCKHYVYQLGCTHHANCEYEPQTGGNE